MQSFKECSELFGGVLSRRDRIKGSELNRKGSDLQPRSSVAQLPRSASSGDGCCDRNFHWRTFLLNRNDFRRPLYDALSPDKLSRLMVHRTAAPPLRCAAFTQSTFKVHGSRATSIWSLTSFPWSVRLAANLQQNTVKTVLDQSLFPFPHPATSFSLDTQSVNLVNYFSSIRQCRTISSNGEVSPQWSKATQFLTHLSIAKESSR